MSCCQPKRWWAARAIRGGQADSDGGSCTDHFDFMLEGVPTFVAEQDEANYLVNYHATSDTYDKVDFPQLKKHVAEAAVLSFALANAPERVGPAWIERRLNKCCAKPTWTTQ